jgi:hypothetical protein
MNLREKKEKKNESKEIKEFRDEIAFHFLSVCMFTVTTGFLVARWIEIVTFFTDTMDFKY